MIKKKLVYLLQASWMLIIFSSCSNDDEVLPGLTADQLTVIDYFKEIALGNEFSEGDSVTRKWESDMVIFVDGSPSNVMLTELDKVMGEINELATDGFQVRVTEDPNQSNYYIFFGSAAEYAAIYPGLAEFANLNFGLFSLETNVLDVIVGGTMYVDIERANSVEQRHLLREELTQSLGLPRDSERFADSIFQERWTRNTTYSDIDKELIRLLYHPRMRAGLGTTQVEALITDILRTE